MAPPILLTLHPGKDVEHLHDSGCARARWSARGNDPFFACTWDGGPLLGGWYLASVEWRVRSGQVLSPVFYPDYGYGASETDAVQLPLAIGTGEAVAQQVLVRFVADTQKLRLDPSVGPVEFTMAPLYLKRVSRLRALCAMAGALLITINGWKSRLRFLAGLARVALRDGASQMGAGLYQRYSMRVVATLQSNYSTWLSFHDRADEAALSEGQARVERLKQRKRISVVMPVYQTPETWLRRAIESVRAQVYPDWELCIADDASTDPRVVQVVREYLEADPRIKLVVRDTNGHISHASNSALALATGDYIALLDHDDELHPFALLEVAEAFAANPRWRMLYTDEDKIDAGGQRLDPYFKPDWNPELFLSQNCVCHLGVYESTLLHAIGGFRAGFEGAQDWDLALRATEQLHDEQVGHVAKVLYHWRAIEGSTAMAASEKSYAHVAALRAVREHLARRGEGARVEEVEGSSGYFRIRHPLPTPAPLVSLLIPTRDRVDLLKQCIDSILMLTTYPDYEIIVADNGSVEPASLAYFEEVQRDPRVRVVPYPHPFNYSAINNFAAQAARGQVLGLINNDIEVISPGWLEEMVGHALRPDVGVVGAMLYYPDDTIQHAGVVVGMGGVAGHAYVGCPRGYAGSMSRARLAQAVSAVTAACAVVRRSVFEAVGGLDQGLQVAFNDVDLCLRVREQGYRNVWTPFAELYHHESASRGYEDTPEKMARFQREVHFMQRRWGDVLEYDPYYNPNLTLTAAPFTLAFPPRPPRSPGVRRRGVDDDAPSISAGAIP